MTDAQFETWMKGLTRVTLLDAQGTTHIGRLYAQPPQFPAAHDHQRDTETHQYNQEWTDQ